METFKPGTLIVPEMGFWLNVSSQAWRVEVENPSAKMRPFIRGGDKMLLGILLDEAHNGLVLSDNISTHPYTDGQWIQSTSGWDFTNKVVTERKIVLLFGERKVTFVISNIFLADEDIGISNQGWKVVSTPSEGENNE